LVSEWTSEFGGNEPEGLPSLMQALMDDRMSRHLTANQRAWKAWYRANGDRERTHTKGVFLRRPRSGQGDPLLVVYVDSHALVTDFGVNKELYLARLANVGFRVSGISFQLSRKKVGSQGQRTPRPSHGLPSPLPELDAREHADVASLVSELPESLRATAARAIELSKQRAKLESSRHGSAGGDAGRH
jgi:hypothetical protein